MVQQIGHGQREVGVVVLVMRYENTCMNYHSIFRWSAKHINELWGITPEIVYPPCGKFEEHADEKNIENIAETILETQSEINILSVGQIRPEKNHLEQLRIFAKLRGMAEDLPYKVKAIRKGMAS